MKLLSLTFFICLGHVYLFTNWAQSQCLNSDAKGLELSYEKLISVLSTDSYQLEYDLSELPKDSTIKGKQLLKIINAQKMWVNGDDSLALIHLYSIVESAYDDYVALKCDVAISKILLDNSYTEQGRKRLQIALEKYNLNITDHGDIYAGIGYSFYEEMNYDSSYKYLSKALGVFKKLECPYKSTDIILNISALQIDNNRLQEAKLTLDSLLSGYSNSLTPNDMSSAYSNLAYISEAEGHFYEAILNYNRALEADTNLTNDIASSIYEGLFLCYAGIGNYDSVNLYFDKYYQLNEARNQEITNKHILDIEAKYQLAQRKKEIQLAQKEKRLVELENEEKKHTISQLLLYIIAAVLAVILLLVIIFNTKRKAKARIASHRQKIENLIKDQSILSIQSQIEGQEKERQRIAKDLHDKVGGYLATIKLSVDQLAKENDGLKSIQKLTSTTIDEVRSISHNLDSEALQTDLHQLLVDLGENISSHGTIHSDVIYSVNNHLPVGLKKEIYACAMELVTNSLKHSKADEIVIQVMEIETTLQLLYEDNGVGFNPAEIKDGIGIKNIKSRVDKYAGKIIIDSNKNAGCTIIIEFPL